MIYIKVGAGYPPADGWGHLCIASKHRCYPWFERSYRPNQRQRPL